MAEHYRVAGDARPVAPANVRYTRSAVQPSAEIRHLLAASRDPDPEVRRRAVRELCPCQVKRNDPDVWERVFEMTRDPNVRVRRNALHGMIDGSPAGLAPRVVAGAPTSTTAPRINSFSSHSFAITSHACVSVSRS